MPNGKKAVSKKQAGLLGVVAGGGSPREMVGHLSDAKAKDMLRGVKVKKLPEKVSKKKKGY